MLDQTCKAHKKNFLIIKNVRVEWKFSLMKRIFNKKRERLLEMYMALTLIKIIDLSVNIFFILIPCNIN